MSDTGEDIEAAADRLLRESRTGAIRERMREYLAEHDPPTDLKRLRREAASAEELSETVDNGREERI